MALVAALGSMMLCGTAEARGPAAWHELGRIDGTRPAGLACPSRSLCVAVDVAGHVLSSTHPLAARAAWTVANVDPRTRLRALSCPSRRLCVAVDDAGRVLTARNPSRGAASWTSGTVRPGGLLDVSCPSARLCVAVGGPDVAFSRAPRRGCPELAARPRRRPVAATGVRDRRSGVGVWSGGPPQRLVSVGVVLHRIRFTGQPRALDGTRDRRRLAPHRHHGDRTRRRDALVP